MALTLPFLTRGYSTNETIQSLLRRFQTDEKHEDEGFVFAAEMWQLDIAPST